MEYGHRRGRPVAFALDLHLASVYSSSPTDGETDGDLTDLVVEIAKATKAGTSRTTDCTSALPLTLRAETTMLKREW